ncbi:MAG: thiosulfate sulfurtransferase [SAR86 cluster bacterium]|uniref:Thiosulfate sulfurtransferase n=1 Tax=SAR86 cluster bacterium TaxID=2030880 RepID=A0A2A4X0N4_9GAMM|nr:MAG: thiosulfate sulfurtransferase [SAR86 cluster bacterium]
MATLPLIMSPEAFNESLPHDDILLVAVVQQAVFNSHHIRGSILVEPAELMNGEKPAVGKLPTKEKLDVLFSKIGLNSDKHVIVYDDEGGGWAGRLIWTLDIIGHKNYSYLDGGLSAWLKMGLPLSNMNTDDSMPKPTTFSANIRQELLVSKEEVLTSIDDVESIVWDARAPEEFNGAKVTALRNGHIPGAANLNWLELQDRENDLRLKPLQEIQRQLNELGISKDKKVITHCQTHHRSGLTYLVGKALGYDIKAYDGSWSEWGNDPEVPIEI